MNLKTVKLATPLSRHAAVHGRHMARPSRPRFEAEVLELTRNLGIGAQFGGKYFCHDVRVVRLPRHGASLPIGIGVSCSADRQILGKIICDGVFSRSWRPIRRGSCPKSKRARLGGERCAIDLNRPRPISRRPVAISGQDPPQPDRPADRRPRYRARRTAAAARPRRGFAAILPGPPDLLCRPGQDAGGLCLGLVRADHGGTAWIPMSTRSRRRAARWSCSPRATARRQVREACKARRLLSRLDRRTGGEARAGLHPKGRADRISRARHGGDLAHRGRGLPGLHRHRRQGQRFLPRVDLG